MMAVCGLDCGQCGLKDGCAGCGGCGLKEELVREFNALGIPDMPEVAGLNTLPGSYVNLQYTLPGGQEAKFWRDDRVYLGNQLEKLGSGRCYGLLADEKYLMVCEYGQDGADPEIIIFKKRSVAE